MSWTFAFSKMVKAIWKGHDDEPIVAISIYLPAGAATKRSIPTPDSTILPASFLNPGCSVWKSFFSVSIPWRSFLSLKNNLPGPKVGNEAREQMIFPPVALSADTADSKVGNRTGSGFLACEKRSGNRPNKAVIIDLASQLTAAEETGARSIL